MIGSAVRRDPLLTSARAVITLLMGLLVLAGVGALIGAPTMLAFKSSLLAEIARHSGHPVPEHVVIEIVGAVALVAVLAGLAFRFLHLLRRIIDSVALGNSFAMANADRLTQMGWITVLFQVVSIPMGALSHFVDLTVGGDGRPNMGLSITGVLMAMLLFILARVFREGARMREDLEGTV